MILRKNRIHHTGSSNLASPSKPCSKLDNPFQNTLLESSSTPSLHKTLASPTKFSLTSPIRNKSVHDILLKKTARSPVSPQEETERSYEDLNKTKKPRTILSPLRTSHLEEVGKAKTAFTGESGLVYDKKLEKYRTIDEDYSPAPKKQEILHSPRKNKETENAQAIQETQIVGVDKFHAETIKNRVDLEKVREARRVLRRRYANRTNLQKIFAAWDEDNTGVISARNVYNMAKKLDLKLNYDEARVLLASADKSAVGRLGLNEFLDLIYNKDDALNVNLDKLVGDKHDEEYTIGKEELENNDGNLLKKLQEDAKKGSEAKHMNQLKLVLKNRINDLNHIIREIDTDQTGYLNLFKFEQAIQRLRINETVLPLQDIHKIFDKHKVDSIKLNYKTFLENLNEFEFHYDQEYKESNSSKTKKKALTTRVPQLRPEQYIESLKVVDCRSLPYNMIENFFARSKKVGRALQRFFPGKEQFMDYLANHVGVEKGKAEDHYVSNTEFKGIVEDLSSKFDVNGLTQRDLEGFLSSILYNKQGYTTFKEISKTIYDETEEQFFDKIQHQRKGPAPHSKIAAFDLSLPTQGQSIEIKTEDDGANEGRLSQRASPMKLLQKKALKINTNSPVLPPIKAGSLSVRNQSSSPTRSKKKLDDGLKNILKNLDDKLFTATKSTFNTFREFDMDKDGFVSYNDFVKRLEDKQFVNKEDIPKLLNYLDPDQKGFVDFTDFSKKIRKNMAYDDESGEAREDKGKSAAHFVKPDFTKISESATSTKKFIDDVKSFFSSTSKNTFSGMKKNTRTSSNPGWTNSFLNFQAPSNSAMFLSEEERFDRHRLAATKFQKEELRKTQFIQEKRVEVRREYQNIIKTQREKEEAAFDAKNKARMNSKLQNLLAYEQNARLRNPFV